MRQRPWRDRTVRQRHGGTERQSQGERTMRGCLELPSGWTPESWEQGCHPRTCHRNPKSQAPQTCRWGWVTVLGCRVELGSRPVSTFTPFSHKGCDSSILPGPGRASGIRFLKPRRRHSTPRSHLHPEPCTPAATLQSPVTAEPSPWAQGPSTPLSGDQHRPGADGAMGARALLVPEWKQPRGESGAWAGSPRLPWGEGA